MKVYVIIYSFDNGLVGEEYTTYEEYLLYSTLEKASEVFWNKASSDYEGKYELYSWELDTQRQELLEYTPYIPCTFDGWDEPEPPEDYYDNDDSWPDAPSYETPEKNIKCAWEYLKYEQYYSYNDEIQLENEYLTSKGTNYQAFKEADEEIQQRLLESLNKDLDDLLCI